MNAIQEFEQYCALHPDPWLQAIQAIQNQPLQSFEPLPPLPPVQSFESWCQQYTPPAPQAQKEEDKQLLQQAIVEENAEINAEKQTEPDSKSTLSSMSRLCATRSSGDSAACFSNARLFARRASCLASFLTSFFGDFLTSFFALASFLAWHGLLPGYIECMEGMEATGQG